jgi:serine/threonine protein kinase
MKQIGQYIILKQIGSGATSAVYIAKHSKTNQKCCAKIISKINISNKKDREHLCSEIKILQQYNMKISPSLLNLLNYQNIIAFLWNLLKVNHF